MTSIEMLHAQEPAEDLTQIIIHILAYIYIGSVTGGLSRGRLLFIVAARRTFIASFGFLFCFVYGDI